MYSNIEQRSRKRIKRALRIRKHVRGSSEQPRLSVLKTNKHISAQLIDDDAGRTLVSAGTMHKNLKTIKSKDSAREVGKKLAEQAVAKNITKVVFDRGRYKYHGLIAELAQAAREAGLQF